VTRFQETALASGTAAALIVMCDGIFPASMTQASRAVLSDPHSLGIMAAQGAGISLVIGAMASPSRWLAIHMEDDENYSSWLTIAAMVLIAFGASWMFVAQPFPTTYKLVRYFVPALIWTILFWRRGFVSCIAAHACVYLVFGPLIVFMGG
jgi:hypothetical protein